MTPLTQKQKELLEFIASHVAETNGVAPSFEEMKEAVSLKSKSGVHRLVTALEQRGHIRKLPNRARAIEVVKEGKGLAQYSIYELMAEIERRKAASNA